MDLNAAGLAAQSAANFDELERIAREMIRRAEAEGNLRDLARGCTFLGNSKLHVRDGAAAEEAYKKALAVFEQIGDRHGVARVNMNLGAVAFDIHLDVETARQLFVKTLPVFQEFGDDFRLGVALGNLAEVARLDGNFESALDYAKRAFEKFSSIDDSDRCTWMTLDIAHIHLLRREQELALKSLDAARELLRANRNVIWTAVYFEIWFMIAMMHDQWDAAGRLLGFADRYRADHHVPRLQGMLPWLGPHIERLQTHHRSSVDERKEGEALGLADAYAVSFRLESLLRERQAGAE